MTSTNIEYRVRSGDTLYAIARRYNVTLEALSLNNGISDVNRIWAGQVLKIPKERQSSSSPPPKPRTHRVLAGETLSKIAQRNNTTVEALAQANGIRDPNRIGIGQVLKIPQESQPTARSPVPGTQVSNTNTLSTRSPSEKAPSPHAATSTNNRTPGRSEHNVYAPGPVARDIPKGPNHRGPSAPDMTWDQDPFFQQAAYTPGGKDGGDQKGSSSNKHPEQQKEPDLVALLKNSTKVESFGRVVLFGSKKIELAFRDRPDPSGVIKKRLAENTHVFVSRRLPGDWYFVRLEDGSFGFVASTYVWINPPEPNAYLYKVEKKQGAQAIAKQQFLEIQEPAYRKKNRNAKAIDWGQDERHYVNALLYANQGPQNGTGERGISKPNETDPWDATQTFEGVYIWVPSLEFAMSLKGKIPSGSLTFDTWQAIKKAWDKGWEAFKSAAKAVADYYLGSAAFAAGLIHGALESVWDLLTGIVDLVGQVWDLIKSLFSGELFAILKDFWDWVQKQDVDKLMEEGLKALLTLIKESVDSLKKKWNDPDFLKRWHFRGWVIGYIVAELVMEFFTGGAALAKWAAKAGNLLKRFKEFQKLLKLAEKAKGLSKKLPEASQQKLKKALDKPSDEVPSAKKPDDKKPDDKKSTDKKSTDKKSTDKKDTGQPNVVDDVTHWPPQAPKGKKPKIGTANAAEWRYNRYRYQQYTKHKKTQKEILDFEDYKKRHYKAAANGGRPGRKGGMDQVKTRKMLEREGFIDTETTSLGGKYIDLYKPNNGLGGIDYVEVDSLLQKGVPIKRLREKLKVELAHLKKGDRLIYVDKKDPKKRIIYQYGDDPGIIDTKTWNN